MSILIQEFKAFIQTPSDDVEKDAEYGLLLDRAKAILTNKLGYSWEKTAVVNEKHDPERMVYLNVLPILTTPAPVVLVDSETLTANTDYYVYRNYILIPDIVTDTPLTVDVSYTGGYLETDAGYHPYSQMLFELMKYWIQLQDTTQPGAFIDYRIPREVDELLINYKVFNL